VPARHLVAEREHESRWRRRRVAVGAEAFGESTHPHRGDGQRRADPEEVELTRGDVCHVERRIDHDGLADDHVERRKCLVEQRY
jgi:hypothetical protein